MGLLTAAISRHGIDHDQRNIADGFDLPAKCPDVRDEAEHSLLALLAHHLDDVDAVEVSASGD
jgi:hypothetical protein